MNPEDSGRLFEEYFDSIFKDSNILTEEQFRMVADNYEINFGEFMPQDKDSNILDVGCGCGHFLYYLKRKGYTNFYGIDISPQQIDYCKKNISERVETTDIFDFLKDKATIYDLISMISVLEHIPKDKILALLRLVFISLQKNGTIVVIVPNMSNPLSINSRYRDFTHECGFTEKSLYQVLWTSGFRDIKLCPLLSNPPVTWKQWVWILLHLLVRQFIKFLYRCEGYNIPEILTPGLIGIAKRMY